jgi:hypothetical protein
MIDYDRDNDWDRPEFMRVTHPKARKPWWCASCKKERPAGVRYEYVVCKMPGEPLEITKRCILDPNHDCQFEERAQ